jgi:hypothetical protein
MCRDTGGTHQQQVLAGAHPLQRGHVVFVFDSPGDALESPHVGDAPLTL